MKSDKEMFNDVLMRVADVRQQKKQQKKIAVKTLSVAFAFIFVFMAGLTVFNDGAEPSVTLSDVTSEAVSVNTVNKAFSVVVASAAENSEVIAINKESSVSIPFGGLLYVKKTSSTAGANIAAYETECKLNEIFGENDKCSVIGIEGDTCVYFGTVNYLSLKIADADAVEEITFSCGENGKLFITDNTLIGNIKEFHKTIKTGKEIIISGEEYKNVYEKSEGMVFKWSPSEELHEKFSNNPETSFSSAGDSIDVVIRYNDDTEESFTINLSFDEEGILKADYSYNN